MAMLTSCQASAAALTIVSSTGFESVQAGVSQAQTLSDPSQTEAEDSWPWSTVASGSGF